jgi:hypothetical protein
VRRWSLAQWIELCREDGVDDRVVGSSWVTAGITPPPVADPPITRYPLEQAEALLERAAGASDAATAALWRSEAGEWLDHPHPRASPAVRSRMSDLRRRVGVDG